MPSLLHLIWGLFPWESALRRHATVRKRTWGIFEVAYDDIPTTNCLYRRGKGIRTILRFISDLCRAAGKPLLILILSSLWMSTTPALSMYLSFTVLQNVQSAASKIISTPERLALLGHVMAWLACAVSSSLVEHILNENRHALSAHLKAFFLPLLAKACLELDIDYDPVIDSSFPDPWGFSHSPAPALNLLDELFSRARDIMTICLEALALAHVVSVQSWFDATLMKFLGLLFLFVVFVAPSNAVGGAGYTFWTKNPDFHKLHGLYSIIFQVKYRETIAKDGANNRLYQEYQRTSDNLGAIKSDTLSLACNIPPPWYWMVARTIIVDYPMALYALSLPWTLSPSCLITMALYQHAISVLSQSIDRLRRFRDPTPIMCQIQRFYETLDSADSSKFGTLSFPSRKSSKRGAKLSFKNVSCSYSCLETGSNVLAVDHVSFDVKPGQLVVIVGGNGCGKTSLLKLLCGLNKVATGDILIDDQSIEDYNIDDLRRSMSFLTQSEEIFPISLRENLLMGIPHIIPQASLHHIDSYVDEAARLGGAYELIQQLGYDTVLNPPAIVGQSMKMYGNGDIGPGAIEELQRNSQSSKETILSAGEKQRLVASRTFMRIRNSDIRLVVIDEPTSALDPVAEHDLFDNFCKLRKGKTLICVTHRFNSIVKQADLVLCMKRGKIVQQGTHAELIRDELGEYRRLYMVQAD